MRAVSKASVVDREHHRLTSGGLGDALEVLLLAAADGHGVGLDELFHAEFVNAARRQHYSRACGQNLRYPSLRNVRLSATNRIVWSNWTKSYVYVIIRTGKEHEQVIFQISTKRQTYSRRIASNLDGSSTTTEIPRCIFVFCSEKSRQAIFAFVTRIGIAEILSLSASQQLINIVHSSFDDKNIHISKS
jgi:hypothetical protein